MTKAWIKNGDNLDYLKKIEDNSVQLIYIDPPFNTGHIQSRKQTKMKRDENNGDRIGYNGQKYSTEVISENSYNDSFDNFKEFIYPRIQEAYRILKENGSLFFHIDYREVHYCKIWLDEIFGRRSFINEIIWFWDYGAKSKSKYSCKHNNILWYAKNPDNYIFNYDQIDRIPYMAPEMVTKEKAEKGKVITDVWWNSIVGTNSKEKTGYPSQKPKKIIDRIIKMHSNENDLCMDFFAGSGTVGESCLDLNRNCILIDKNPEAINIMKKRFEKYKDKVIFTNI